MQKGRRTFSGMLARLRQKALKVPCVNPEPSPRMSPRCPCVRGAMRETANVCAQVGLMRELRRYPLGNLGFLDI